MAILAVPVAVIKPGSWVVKGGPPPSNNQIQWSSQQEVASPDNLQAGWQAGEWLLPGEGGCMGEGSGAHEQF